MEMLNNTDRSRILLVNTESSVKDSLSSTLDRNLNQIVTTRSLEDALTVLRDEVCHLVIVGNADGAGGKETIETIRCGFPWLEVIAIIGNENKADATEIIAMGAHDCLTYGSSTQELSLRVTKALEHRRMKQELINLRQQVAMSYGFDNIVGISQSIVKIKETVRRVSATDITISLNGPSGSGKELLAKVIHHHSVRRKAHFVTVDCSSIPESIFEYELFGEGEAPPGSEASANSCLLKQAEGGTIFFDDVDRLPPSLQPRLMSFLKNFTIRPAGQHESQKIDVRVMSASSRNLEAMVEEGCFSKELYYQFSVLPLSVPGLVKRPDDIEMLTEYFLRRLAHEMDRPLFEVTRRALDLLVGHTWPGNVRELENTLKRATALCRNNCIDADDILFIGTTTETEPSQESVETAALQRKTGLLDEGQRSIIFRALSENDWNFTQTAQELGIGRTTLWRKVKKYNLKREQVTQV